MDARPLNALAQREAAMGLTIQGAWRSLRAGQVILLATAKVKLPRPAIDRHRSRGPDDGARSVAVLGAAP